MRQVQNLLVGAALGLAATVAAAQVPAGYPAAYGDTIAAAKKEGKVVVYSTTDSAAAKYLIDDFKALYPGISVEYNDMGSNNRVAGRIVERRGNSALLGGDGWRIWGESRASGAAAGSEATGMIRLERVRLADGPGDNAIKLPLVTSMFLGDRWEYLFHQGDLRLRAYGARPLPPGEQWLEIPAESFWIF